MKLVLFYQIRFTLGKDIRECVMYVMNQTGIIYTYELNILCVLHSNTYKTYTSIHKHLFLFHRHSNIAFLQPTGA